MALAVQDALFHASHTLGHGTSGEQSPVGGLFILNDAGRRMVNSHSWHWMMRPDVKLDFHKDVEHVWLPQDFGELVGYDVTSGLASSLSMTTHQHLVDLRTNSITTSTWRYWAAVTQDDRGAKATATLRCTDSPTNGETLVLDDGINPAVTITFLDTLTTETATARQVATSAYTTPAEAAVAITDAINAAPLLFMQAVDGASTITTVTHGQVGVVGNLGAGWATDGNSNFTIVNMGGGVDPGAHRARLDIWPAPTTDEAEALTIYYRGRWRTIDEDTKVVPVPEYMEGLYIDFVRAIARGYEMQDEVPMHELISEVRGGDTWADAMKADSQTQHVVGQLTGGAVTSVSRQRNPSHLYNFAAVPDQ